MMSRQAARDRQSHPRCEGARRPVGERGVRGRQERAGVRRRPDPDARGAHQERDAHRREPLDRPRPDRFDGQRRERRRQGDVHDRRLRRGQARRGPDLEREPRRSIAARPARRARRSSSRCRPATSCTRSPASAAHVPPSRVNGPVRSEATPVEHGRTSSRSGSGTPARRSSTTPRPRRAPSTSGAFAARSSSMRSRARCARAVSRRRSSTGSTTSTRWMPRRS